MWRVWITFSLNIPTKHMWFLICTDMIESILNNIGIWPIHLFCAQVLSHVRLFATPWTVAHQAPLSIGILQTRILEWVPMPSSKGSFQTRDRTQVSFIAGRFQESPDHSIKIYVKQVSRYSTDSARCFTD